MRYASIALDVPLRSAFTWSVPTRLDAHVARGVAVRVPWRGRIREGIVLAVNDEPPQGFDPRKIRAIADLATAEPLVTDPQLELAERVARYYHAPIGEAVKLVAPGLASDSQPARAVLVNPETSAWPAALNSVLTYLVESDGSEEVDVLVRRLDVRVSDLRTAEAAGLLTITDASHQRSWRPRVIDRVLATGIEPDRRPSSRQADVLAFLAEHHESDSDELRELFEIDRAGLRALEKRGLVRLSPEERHRDPFGGTVRLRDGDPVLTHEQDAALAAIQQRLGDGGGTVLLRGVTGSGKTEVYLRAARQVLHEGGRVLVLLPEIALTPQFVGVFRAVLGDRIAVQHSGLTSAERRSQWLRIRRGELPVVIGARSAVFAPLGPPALIIVDEEHDPSFKQDTGVRYSGRDVALMLAQLCGATTVLGSATPSVESVRNAAAGRYARVDLLQRPAARPLPAIELVDMRAHVAPAGDAVGRYFSPPLQLAMRDTWRAGEQTILFLNRRGFAPVVECGDCGQAIECAACDVSMTYHRRGNVVKCHYCGAMARAPEKCPTCGGTNMGAHGVGTEQIEGLVRSAFDGIRVARLDADSARGTGLRRVLDGFRRNEFDVLIGTQMVTKGHDFPSVTLVGVIHADQSLRFPDFRSGERTFQLLTQVAGRAGRADLTGRVLIQTWDPDHPVLQAAVSGDFDGFASRELEHRARLFYPPVSHALLVRLDGVDYGRVARRGDEVARTLSAFGGGALRITGPVDSPIARINERYRMQIFVRSAARPALHAAISAVEQTLDAGDESVHVVLDIDPQNLL